MREINDAAMAARGTRYLLVLSVCGVLLAAGLLIAGLADIRAGRWFGPGGGFISTVTGALLGVATARVVGLWRKAKGL